MNLFSFAAVVCGVVNLWSFIFGIRNESTRQNWSVESDYRDWVLLRLDFELSELHRTLFPITTAFNEKHTYKQPFIHLNSLGYTRQYPKIGLYRAAVFTITSARYDATIERAVKLFKKFGFCSTRN